MPLEATEQPTGQPQITRVRSEVEVAIVAAAGWNALIIPFRPVPQTGERGGGKPFCYGAFPKRTMKRLVCVNFNCTYR